MEKWMALVLLYGTLKGIRDVIKKKALDKSSVIEVLFFYTLIGFLFVIPDAKEAFKMDMSYLGFIFFKSFIIFIAWICSFTAIRKMPISLYGVMDLARVLFATLLGVLVLHESLSINQIIGLILVMAGLILVNLKKDKKEGATDHRYAVFALISCLLNAVSGLTDKMIMKDIESGQLQFWYMFFMVLLYLAYILISRTKIQWKTVWKNYWIPILSILFIIADRALFIANGIGESRVTIMTMLKQSCVLITILAGWLVFKEKHVIYRLICAAIVVTGIVIAVM